MNLPNILLHPTAEAQLDAFLKAPMHAVLLAGPNGIGKTHIGTGMASELLRVATPEQNAYFRIILPEKSIITIEQVRELISFFRLKVPGTADIRRVAIIQDADTMGTEAQNALLKLLEEPPIDSVLILTSSQPQALLPTIRSRIQLLQLAVPDTDALMRHFVALGYDRSAVTNALLRASTNIAEARGLLDGDTDTDKNIIDLVKQALGGSIYDRLLLVDRLAKQKNMAADFAHALAVVATVSLEAAARKGNASVDRWGSVLQAASTAEDALARSGNAKLILTELMLAM